MHVRLNGVNYNGSAWEWGHCGSVEVEWAGRGNIKLGKESLNHAYLTNDTLSDKLWCDI